MPNFRYLAINKENKKVAGQITADTEDLARKELHRLGFSVLTMGIQDPNKKQVSVGVKNFEFEGVDKTGKPVKGTIEGTSELPVYRRLIEEYGFRITYLADEDATPEEKTSMRKQGLYDLQNMYEQSKKDLAAQTRSWGDKFKDFFGKWAGNEDEEIRQAKADLHREQFLKQVDKAIAKARTFMNENTSRLSGQIRHDMQTAFDHVARIRNSNNEKNIKMATEEMLSILQRAKKALDMELKPGEDRIDYAKIKIDSDPEMQHSDETETEYILRMQNILRQKDTHDLFVGIFKDVWRLIAYPQKGITFKRISMKWQEYMRKYKAEMKSAEEKRSQEMAEKGAVQVRHRFAKFAWIWDEIHGFTGILLFFYVLYFVVAGVLATKNLGIDGEVFQRTLESDLLRQMLLFTFMLYFFGQIYNLYINEKRNRVRVGYWTGFAVLLVFFSVNL